MIQYTLVRSRRKTVAIHITKAAAAEVRAPLKMPKADIDRFVNSKEKWIETHLERRKRLNDKKASFALNYGDMAALCGIMHPIRAVKSRSAGFDGEGFFVPSGLEPEEIKSAVIRVYKSEAKRIIGDKLAEYSKRMDVAPATFRITGAKTVWGSCGGKNSINFSWRLVMAGEDVIDYVVVHELSHIKEHNHSRRFWAVVESVLPDYMVRKKKLRLLQEKLAAQDWD